MYPIYLKQIMSQVQSILRLHPNNSWVDKMAVKKLISIYIKTTMYNDASVTESLWADYWAVSKFLNYRPYLKQ